MRAQVFAFLVAVGAVAVPLAAQAAPCVGFTDVDDTSPFCASVEWIKNRAITSGCTATAYCPNDNVTRLQMAAFLARLQRYLAPYVVDANGQSIGRLLSEDRVEVDTNGERILLWVSDLTSKFYNEQRIYYASTNCTGQAYGDITSHWLGVRRGKLLCRQNAIYQDCSIEELYIVSDVFDTLAVQSYWEYDRLGSACVRITTLLPHPYGGPVAWYRANGPYPPPAFVPPFKILR